MAQHADAYPWPASTPRETPCSQCEHAADSWPARVGEFWEELRRLGELHERLVDAHRELPSARSVEHRPGGSRSSPRVVLRGGPTMSPRMNPRQPARQLDVQAAGYDEADTPWVQSLDAPEKPTPVDSSLDPGDVMTDATCEAPVIPSWESMSTRSKKSKTRPRPRTSILTWLSKTRSNASEGREAGSRLVDWLNHQLTLPPTFEDKVVGDSCVARFVNSWTFSFCSGCIIVVNSIYIGIYADFTIQNELMRIDGNESAERWWIFIQVFDCLFLAEIFCRFIAEGKHFYWGKNSQWNIFDTVIVVTSASNMLLARRLDSVPQVSYLRILRLVRVIHTFDVFRLPFFAHLRMISNAMVQTLPVCFWAMTIGGMCLYMSGVAFVLGIAQKMQTVEHAPDGRTAADVATLRRYFPDLKSAMKHLYMGISGGIDWEDIYLSLDPLNNAYRIGMLLYTVFLIFVVVNIIAGMVIERAFKVVRQDRDFWMLEAGHQNAMYEDRVRGLFYQIDTDRDGTITWDEFSDAMTSPHIEAYLSFIEVDTADLFDVFQLLDKDGSKTISIDEFVDGVHELRGVVHKAQVKQLHSLLILVVNELNELRSGVRASFEPSSSATFKQQAPQPTRAGVFEPPAAPHVSAASACQPRHAPLNISRYGTIGLDRSASAIDGGPNVQYRGGRRLTDEALVETNR